MNPSPPPPRRFSRDLVRAAAVVAAAVFTVSIVQAARRRDPHASAAGVNSGTLTFVDPVSGSPITSGSATTAFLIVPPSGAACTGDTATGQFRVNSYIVPSTVDPATLTWNNTGPVPAGAGANLRQPLFSTTGQPLNNFATAQTTALINAALGNSYDFNTFQTAGGPTLVPDGVYNMGISCSLSGAGDKFWNVQLTFAAQAGVLNWTVGVVTPPTTTTTTVAPTTSTTTTTIAPTTSTSTTTSTTIAPTTSTSTTSTTSTTTSTTIPRTTTTTSTTIAPTTSTSTTTSTTIPRTTTTTSTTIAPTTTTSPATTTTAPAGGTTTTVEKEKEHEREKCSPFAKRRGGRCEKRSNSPWLHVLGL